MPPVVDLFDRSFNLLSVQALVGVARFSAEGLIAIPDPILLSVTLDGQDGLAPVFPFRGSLRCRPDGALQVFRQLGLSLPQQRSVPASQLVLDLQSASNQRSPSLHPSLALLLRLDHLLLLAPEFLNRVRQPFLLAARVPDALLQTLALGTIASASKGGVTILEFVDRYSDQLEESRRVTTCTVDR